MKQDNAKDMSLGDRMKHNYEDRQRYYLQRRTPAIIRLDGKAFHTLTRKCNKPFDFSFMMSMLRAAMQVAENIQGFKLAFIQSDEVSFLMTDYDKVTTDAWFDYNINKIVSISASIMSVAFSDAFDQDGFFDGRVFNLPKEEVANYFLWRAQDWHRNSVSMYAQSFFSAKQLHKKNQPAMHDMLHEIGKNWATDLGNIEKNGSWILTDKSITNEILPTYDSINAIVNPLITINKENSI